MTNFISSDDIRLAFSEAMSAMYRAEVPLYGDLLDIVATVNARTLAADPVLQAQLEAQGELERLSAERHGAIRVGTPAELAMMRRLFAVMGLHPVGYYDLAAAGLPVHSTAFRPVERQALSRCAFRIFCSLLRLDLIEDETLRTRAADILSQRRIVSDDALFFIEKFEADGGLDSEEAEAFVLAALETFRWHGEALVDAQTYAAFSAAHRLVADIVCFRGPHINHLTPRALDIDAVQAEMIARGIRAKAVIEGPPRRNVPILLRQTSFQALEEPILFRDADGGTVAGAHTARFGEIEQRGVALTPSGRALYDEILAEVETARADAGDYQARLAATFARLPDDLPTLRTQGLAYFSYAPARPLDGPLPDGSADDLVDAGLLVATPITYEDFLPVSAAGIFRSNLSDAGEARLTAESSQEAFEAALGAPCLDPFGLYLAQEEESLERLSL